MRTLYWCINLVLTYLYTCAKLLPLKKMRNEGKINIEEFRRKVTDIVAQWAESQIKASGSKIIVKGIENIPENETVVFVSNHQGNFDFAAILAYIKKPMGFLAKDSLIKIPMFKACMECLDCVYIDRADTKNAAKALIDGINVVKGGHSLLVFPEGTRSKSNKLGEFKGGAFKLATKSKKPIIPITVSETYKIMEANKPFAIKPCTAYLIIHSPIYTESL